MGIVIVGIFIGYVVISLVVLVIVVKLTPKGKWKWLTGLMVILTSILIPTWDIPIGRINFNRLCETQAGQFIYKEVPLGDEYFLKAGERNTRYSNPRAEFYYAKGGELNLEKVKESYSIDTRNMRNYSRWGNVFKRVTTITSLYDHVTLSRAISFHYGGGWLVHSIAGGTSKVCPQEGKLSRTRPYTIHSNLSDMTFKKISNTGDIQ